MPIPIIFVGCGRFGLQRLQLLVEDNQFAPVACVDIDVEQARIDLNAMGDRISPELGRHVYSTISEAKEKHYCG